MILFGREVPWILDISKCFMHMWQHTMVLDVKINDESGQRICYIYIYIYICFLILNIVSNNIIVSNDINS